jgi:UDP:flavonoid glycosyltransferase YjiC (YdhE family)
MANILFVTWDGGGNVPPAIGIAAELQRRGDTVRVLGHEQQRSTIEGAGLRFESYTQPVPFSSAAPKSSFHWFTSMTTLVRDRSLGADLLKAVQREPTDFVVIDCVLATVLEAAAQAGLRRAVLVHSFLSIGAWSMRSEGPIARLRGRHSTGPWGGADLGLVATLRSLDPDGTKTWPPSIRFTGPVWQGTPRPANRPAGEPKVLVSLSTCSFPGQRQVLQNILDALNGLPVQAIVTTGPAVSPADLRAPANAELYEYLPHSKVLPTVSLVIGHGGHATTMAALAHDLPVIVLPMLKLMDQRKIGQAVQNAGAGRLLPKQASPARIHRAVQELLENGAYRLAAASLGTEIRQQDGASTAADAIAHTLARHAAT